MGKSVLSVWNIKLEMDLKGIIQILNSQKIWYDLSVQD